MSIVFKQSITVFLAWALLLQTFTQTVIVVNFYVNQDYIARTLCINRDRPVMRCGGRCQLSKRLTQDDANKDKSSPPERKLSFADQDLSAENGFACLSYYEAAVIRHARPLPDLRVIDRSIFCFHPPD